MAARALFAAAFRALGVDARADAAAPTTARANWAPVTLPGDECYPAKVTVGDFMKVLEDPACRPCTTRSLFMPTARGPVPLRAVRRPICGRSCDNGGYTRTVEILSPTSQNSYGGLGSWPGRSCAPDGARCCAADILQKMLLCYRPHEGSAAIADAVYEKSLDDLCRTLESRRR